MKNDISISDELDFHYLLSLLPPLQNEPEFAWLPELFSIIGHEKLIQLCKYAGGETIKLPTLEELSNVLYALQWFYDIDIKKSSEVKAFPKDVHELYMKVSKIYAESN